MYDYLTFYSNYGNGDIFESREFVREMMQSISAKEYYYAHSKNGRMFADIPNLKYTEITTFMDDRKSFFKLDNSLFINTWIGRDF